MKTIALLTSGGDSPGMNAALRAAKGDIVVLATGYGDALAALRSLGDLSGKVIIDITNPLTADCNTSSTALEWAKHAARSPSTAIAAHTRVIWALKNIR